MTGTATAAADAGTLVAAVTVASLVTSKDGTGLNPDTTRSSRVVTVGCSTDRWGNNHPMRVLGSRQRVATMAAVVLPLSPEEYPDLRALLTRLGTAMTRAGDSVD